MTSSAPPAPSIGSHPLTGKLVGTLRQGPSGLSFAASDLEQFLTAGRELGPDDLIAWIRDLGTLAVTLRDDLMANSAATQIERGLVDPLVRLVEYHTHAAITAVQTRSNAVETLVKAQRRKLQETGGPGAALAPKPSSAVGAYVRGRQKKKKP